MRGTGNKGKGLEHAQSHPAATPTPWAQPIFPRDYSSALNPWLKEMVCTIHCCFGGGGRGGRNSAVPEAAHVHVQSGQQQRAAVMVPSSAQATAAVKDLAICTAYTSERLV